LAGHRDKSAYALCIFAYGEPGKEVKLFSGRVDGTIVEPRGNRNFGFDPCFVPLGYKDTFAEMNNSKLAGLSSIVGKETKKNISHRAKALDELRDYFHSF
jgi:inosine triphosphate pyrophosphatase